MKKKKKAQRIARDIFWTWGPSALLLSGAALIAVHYAHPAPPERFVIATGDGEGGYQWFASKYRAALGESGIELDLRPTTGARENLELLLDPKSNVDVAFVQDGLEPRTTDSPPAEETGTHPNLVSLGSLYYEPLWVFYRPASLKAELTRFSQLQGKRIAIGEHGGGTPALAWRLLKMSGVTKDNADFLRLDYAEAAVALQKGNADAAFFITKPGAPLIKKLIAEKGLRLMHLDQAEAISRQLPYLHHLVLPHGALDLEHNLPDRDTDLVAPTATLVARASLHPALIDLLLAAATRIHSRPGIFERKGEFPIDKDYSFPVSGEAKRYYKSGTPFWQRYLPFWLATLIDRFILVAFPLLAIILPLLKSVPKVMAWRVRSRIYQRYGELKYLETQMAAETDHQRYQEHLKQLDGIEERVNHMRIPLDFSDHLYVLREHIEFVRGRLSRGIKDDANAHRQKVSAQEAI